MKITVFTNGLIDFQGDFGEALSSPCVLIKQKHPTGSIAKFNYEVRTRTKLIPNPEFYQISIRKIAIKDTRLEKEEVRSNLLPIRVNGEAYAISVPIRSESKKVGVVSTGNKVVRIRNSYYQARLDLRTLKLVTIRDKTSIGKVGKEIRTSTFTSINPINCQTIKGTSRVKVKVRPTLSSSDINRTSTTILIRVFNLSAIGSQLRDECSDRIGKIPEMQIPVKVGEWQEIVTFPSDIEKIYNKPFSIRQIGSRKLAGRVLTLNPVFMTVYLTTGEVFKLTLIPYKSKLVSLFEE